VNDTGTPTSVKSVDWLNLVAPKGSPRPPTSRRMAPWSGSRSQDIFPTSPREREQDPLNNLKAIEQDASPNQSPSPHPGSVTHSPRAISHQRSPSFPRLVLSHPSKRAVRNNSLNIPDIFTMGNPISGLDPIQVDHLPLDVPH
jgi:hypothetical protein